MRRAAISVLAFSCGLFAAALVAAHDEAPLPGHSRRGAAFDAGPRQDAYLMGGTGNVHFPVTSKDPLVQKFVEQGVGQLHGFWYVEAERSFRKAAALDPSCGIAYWGMSLANQLNPTRARQLALEAGRHKAGLTEREQMYLDALSKDDGYRAIFAKYPQDLEAKAFEVWRIWNNYERHTATRADLETAWTLSKQILRADPMHPIHHAVIHIADETDTERRGLDSAAKCGEAAPSIGHMWHMPTHIYYTLKQYPLAAWQLEASIRTEHARMMHDRVLPDQVHLYAHNNEWLVRTLLHVGRVHDARRVAMHMIDLPRHPLWNSLEPPDEQFSSEETKHERPRETHGTSAYYGRERLMQVLRRFEYWDELIDACRSGYLEATRLPAEQGKVHSNLGVAYYSRGDVAAGDRELAALETLRNEQIAAQQSALDEAARGPERLRGSARREVEKRFGTSLATLKRGVESLESYRSIVTGFFVSRTMLYIDLASLVAGEAVIFWLLRRRQLRAILTIVVALIAAGWLFHCHLAILNLAENAMDVDFAFVTQKQLAVGEWDGAEYAARKFAAERVNQVRPEANLVETLYRVGKKDEAREEFQALRELAGMADLDTPPMARLAPIAAEFGFPTDWRLPAKIEKELAGRRPLPSLGPFLWRPWTAPEWRLKDCQGREHTLAEFRGKPVVLIFFLGRGCLHCQQQLAEFAKKAAEFSSAGLTVIAVSTDKPDTVKKSLDDYRPAPFPFLMLADPEQKNFRAYRAYDDFEQIALHGTFLIDGDGLVRWQDVGSEPFRDAGFVLGESRRLLARPVAPVEPGARVIAQRAERESSLTSVSSPLANPQTRSGR